MTLGGNGMQGGSERPRRWRMGRRPRSMPPLDPRTPPPIRPHLRQMLGYEPVEPVEALARVAGIDAESVLKLDANENPFGAPGLVQEALATFDGYAVYPDPLQKQVRRAIARYIGVPAERVVAGAGSDELLDLVVQALAGPEQRILITPPTFGMYRFLGDLHQVGVDVVERRADFSLDIDAMRAKVSERTALIVIAAPNNPTGNPLAESDLRALLATGTTVLVDEAYAEFAGTSCVSWTAQSPRLIVLRTFSKWAGLAGLRAGYGVFPESLAETLMRIKQPYNLNRAAEVAILATLEHRGELEEQVQAIIHARDQLYERLAGFGWLRPYPSSANFLLCEIQGASGLALKQALTLQGVFVRYFTTPRLDHHVRISAPRPDQVDLLLTRVQEAGASLGLS